MTVKTTTTIKAIALGIVSSLMMTAQASAYSEPNGVQTGTQDFSQLEQYFDALAEQDKVLGAFAIYQDGKKAFDTTYVIKNDALVKGEQTYRYKIGSISKTFTAVLIFQMIEQGKLSLDTKLSTFYPEVANADRITIKMMLNHHSGIFNYTNDEAFLSYYQSPQSNEAMVERIEALEPAFEPNSKGDYSNSNYLLLGYILENLSGKDYGDLVSEHIAKPLGLAHTYLEETTEPSNNEVFSYIKSGSWTEFPQWDMSTADAAGAIVSTTHDLNMFFRGLFNGKLISADSLATMITTEDTYGHGIFKREIEVDGEQFIGYWHNGRIERYSSMMMYFPEQKVGLATLFNADLYDGSKVFKTLTQAAFNQQIELPEFKTLSLSAEQLEVYAGKYKSETHPLAIAVMVKGGQLMAQAKGQGAFPLTPTDEHIFEFSGAGIEITFDPKNRQFVIKQGGRADIFSEIDSSKKEASKDKVAVDVKVLESYVGVYKADNFPLDIEVMLKGEQLQAQATGQQPFPLKPVSNTEFRFDLAGIAITFNASKKELAITQRGNTTLMYKK